MASGSFRFNGFENVLSQLEHVNRDVETFINECAKELAARLLSKVIKRTPVGQYPSDSGKVGGTLRRGWTAGQSATSYAQSLHVRHSGSNYVIEIVNPTEYALMIWGM